MYFMSTKATYCVAQKRITGPYIYDVDESDKAVGTKF